jgi:hypothetical protein
MYPTREPIASSSQPQPISPAQDAMMGLDAAVSTLHETIGALAQHLSTVLRPMPAEAPTAMDKQQSVAPLIDVLVQHRAGVQGATMRLRSIIDGLVL